RRRKRLLRRAWVAAGFALVAAVLGAIGLSQALGARTQLLAARAALQSAVDDPAALGTPQGRAAAVAQVDGALASITGARSRVAGSPVLALAAGVPGLRGQRAGFIQLIDDSAGAAGAGRDLLAAVDSVAARTQLRDGALPLDGLAELQGQVRTAGDAIGRRSNGPAGLWGPLGDARRQFDEVAGSSSRRLTEGAEALGAARTFLAAGGSRRYLVAAQNNAEMRDQGAVLSYAVVSFVDGKMSFEKQGSVADLTLTGPTATPVPPGTQEVFGAIRPTQTWQSVNATADFAFSGRAMADMYRQATGQPVDGVIALDVPALAALLRTVGPVSIEGVAEPVTADNVARLLLNDFYQGLGPTSDQTLRRERQGDVVRAVVDRIASGSRDAVALGRALGDAAQGGHLRLWSAAVAEEDVFERTGLGGGPATKHPERTFHVAVQNRTASKLDYFLKPSVRQDVQVTSQGTAVVRTTVVMENQAPTTGRPSYQFGPEAFTEKPGDYLAWVLLWAPAGSRQLQGGVAESGLNLSQFVLAVPAGERREITFETVVPGAVRDGLLNLRLVPQPRLEPMALSVTLRTEGRVGGTPTTWQGSWDRVQNLSWTLDG
ncbi:MAG: DUF4012 domain-containing protein, partial [Acidimicrobiales bacterium]